MNLKYTGRKSFLIDSYQICQRIISCLVKNNKRITNKFIIIVLYKYSNLNKFININIYIYIICSNCN